ncbi:MAG: class I SAM-dependent methyltransferase [Burkholderiales bacterium]|jgi:16S rRNA (guanine1516-N2)-methyltransferase|nr:class I SAM-dependent methyltransferase [Burkholderiales bacterium]
MSIKLYYTEEYLQEYALTLASIVPDSQVVLFDAAMIVDEQLYLLLNKDTLLLVSSLFKPFDLDLFYNEFIIKRKPGLKREILLQAINLRTGTDELLEALDLTAGLGRDSILMALAGFRVTMLENNPYLAIILNYLSINFCAQLKLTVQYISNDKYLQTNSQKYHVIYFDPMFADGKSSLAKKDMQLIDLMIKFVSDSAFVNNEEVFNLAYAHCLHKLVIKRDNKQRCLIPKPDPTYVKSGKTIRFDVYQVPS